MTQAAARIQLVKDVLRRNRFAVDDRFVLRDGKRHKCAVICPGGAYEVVCSYSEGVPPAEELNKLGISALIVYYRVKGKARFPAPQDDLAAAVKMIFEKAEEYNLDMSDYSVWGFSAGGHLAGSFGTQSMGYAKYHLPKPDTLILAYPVISLEAEITHRQTRRNLIGSRASREEELRYSIHTNVTPDYPRTFIFCGSTDRSVPPVNTRLMTEALEKNSVDHESHIYPNVEHGAGIGTGTAAEGWVRSAAAFWQHGH